MPGVAEQSRSAAVFQQLGQLIGVQGGIQWDDRTSRRNDAEISRDPAWMVVGQNGQTRSASESVLGDPSPDRFGHPADPPIRTTVDVIMTLQFQRGVVRPASGALDKTVVESGHGSWGIYTKSLLTADCAEIAEKAREMFFILFSRRSLRSRR